VRCKYCNRRLEAEEYVWNEEVKNFVEVGKHADGACIDLLTVDEQVDIYGYEHLDDFEEDE